MKHTAIYVRVSSAAQTMASQLPDLERWAAANDEGPGSIVWYQDTYTGRTMDRVGSDWERLELAMARGEVKRIVVWRVDRLGRTAAGLTRLYQSLLDRGIGFISLREGLDLNTPAGRLMAHVLASIAEYETEVRRDRVAAGIAAAKAAGKRWGGSEPGRKIRLTDAKVGVVQSMHERGRPIAEIARTVELSRTSVYKILKEAKSDGSGREQQQQRTEAGAAATEAEGWGASW